MNIKKLQWTDEKPRLLDGKTNGSTAIDDVWLRDRHRLYIRYDVHRGASMETDDNWSIFIQFPSKSFKEPVDSMEDGKIVCEHYRKMFWKDFYKKMMDEIFDGGGDT